MYPSLFRLRECLTTRLCPKSASWLWGHWTGLGEVQPVQTPLLLYPYHLLNGFFSGPSHIIGPAVIHISTRSPELPGSERHLPKPVPILCYPEFILMGLLSISRCARGYAHKSSFCTHFFHSTLFLSPPFFEIHHLGCQHFKLLENSNAEAIFALESINMFCQLFIWYRGSDKSWLLKGFQHVCLTTTSSLPTSCQNQQPSAYIRCPQIFYLVSICQIRRIWVSIPSHPMQTVQVSPGHPKYPGQLHQK